MKMHCFSCRKETEFTWSVLDVCDGPQCVCGHYQRSEAAGALEVCEVATWHDMAEYRRVADIARAGGYTVAEVPRYFVE